MIRRLKRMYFYPTAAILGIAGIALFYWCSRPQDAERIIARVNHSELSLEKLKAALPAEFKGHIKRIHVKEYLDRWVDNQILYQEALRRGIQNEKSVLHEIEQMRQQVIINRLVEDELQKANAVSNADIRNYYAKNREQFIRSEDLVHFFQIVSDSSGLLSEVRRRILRDENFEALARQYSSHPSAQNGGDMGWVKRSYLLPQIETQAFRLKKGSISNVIKTEMGYHIIKVIDIRPKDEIQELDEVEQIILERVKSRKRTERYNHLLAMLKDAAQIEVNLNHIDEFLQKTVSQETNSTQKNE